MSSEGEGCLEEHPAHATHVEWVGEAGAILCVFGQFEYILISGNISVITWQTCPEVSVSMPHCGEASRRILTRILKVKT